VDDRLLALAAVVLIEVVALVLGLNHQPPAQPEQTLALQLVVDKPVADVGDRDVRAQRGRHRAPS